MWKTPPSSTRKSNEGGVKNIPRFHFKFIALPFNAGDTFLHTHFLFSGELLTGAFKKFPFLTGSHLFRSLCRGERLFYFSCVAAFEFLLIVYQRIIFWRELQALRLKLLIILSVKPAIAPWWIIYAKYQHQKYQTVLYIISFFKFYCESGIIHQVLRLLIGYLS